MCHIYVEGSPTEGVGLSFVPGTLVLTRRARGPQPCRKPCWNIRTCKRVVIVDRLSVSVSTPTRRNVKSIPGEGLSVPSINPNFQIHIKGQTFPDKVRWPE